MITLSQYAEALFNARNLYNIRAYYQKMAIHNMGNGTWVQTAWNKSVFSWSLITPETPRPLVTVKPGFSPCSSEFPDWPEAEAEAEAWYVGIGFPGCLYDSVRGPFDSKPEALAEAGNALEEAKELGISANLVYEVFEALPSEIGEDF